MKPEEFVELQEEAEQIGFAGVMSGPLVRSSYRAGRLYQQAVAARQTIGLIPVSSQHGEGPGDGAPRQGPHADRHKAAKAKRASGRQRIRQLVQAYKLTYARDRQLPLWMALAFVGAAAVIFLINLLAGIALFIGIPIAVVFGVLAATFVFGRRAQKAAFSQVEGQPGAAGWVLRNMRGDWRVTQGVQVNAQLDAVHRVLGRPGVVLVGEGAPHRVQRPARAGEEAGRPGRRRHPDLRRHARRRRGRGADPPAATTTW